MGHVEATNGRRLAQYEDRGFDSILIAQATENTWVLISVFFFYDYSNNNCYVASMLLILFYASLK